LRHDLSLATVRHLRLFGALGLLALVAVCALPAASSAETVRGTSGSDRLFGTAGPDVILGFASRDYLEGRRGGDLLNGGTGRDTVFAGTGADRIAAAFDGSVDRIDCGLGRDVATAELFDKVAANCEVVSRQLSRDRFRGLGAQEGTEVEPDSFSNGKVVVATFQIGRFKNGGALAIGFATSRDAGKTWRSGVLPSLTPVSTPAGAEAVADSTVAYDAVHRRWLIASLGAYRNSDAVLISHSRDGLAWGAPSVALRAKEGPDKSWLACDNWRKSRFRGHCYVTYLDGATGGISMRTSGDGGRRWSAAVAVTDGANQTHTVNGAQPLIRPDGAVLVVFTATARHVSLTPDEIAVARSVDGGASFGPQMRVAVVDRQDLGFLQLRAPQFVSGDVDAGGAVHLVWAGCAGQRCNDSDVALASSQDGVEWSAPVRVPTVPLGSGIQSFLPALAVAAGSEPGHTRLAVLYYTMDCGLVTCPINASLITSGDGGRTWNPPRPLSSESMRPTWLANTTLGRMLGDYVSVSYAGRRWVPVFALATAPAGRRFKESIFATQIPR